jgi:thioredoxin-related protein
MLCGDPNLPGMNNRRITSETAGTGIVLSVVLLLGFSSLAATTSPPALKKPTPWLINFDRAMTEARKDDRLVLVYFSGSDWDPWCQKLDSDVLNTDLFRDWAAKNVILMRVDFPRETPLSSTVASQNEQLKARYSISKTPSFVLLDPWGQPLARAGYDEARLRKEEKAGKPQLWIDYLTDQVKHRPPLKSINAAADFNAAVAQAKAKYGILVLLVTSGQTPYSLKERDDILRDQLFVRFINDNVTFVSLAWPDDTDMSPAAQNFRAFATRLKIAQIPFQLIVWDAPFDTVKARLFAYTPTRTDLMISRIQAQLPRVDYSGGWLTDYGAGRTIAAQQDRCIFLAFTSDEVGEWSKKMEDEIFETDDFKKYARKNLVLVKIEASESATQPDVAAERRTLADSFNVRGYPTVVVVNPRGEKLLVSKYMRGGPKFFLSQIDSVIQSDNLRRQALKD